MAGEHELPPGWTVENESAEGFGDWWSVTPGGENMATLDDSADTRAEAVELAWEAFGMTRAAYLDMKAKAERCEDAETKHDEMLSRLVHIEGEVELLRESLDGDEVAGGALVLINQKLRARIAELEPMAKRCREAEHDAELILAKLDCVPGLQVEIDEQAERIAELEGQLAEARAVAKTHRYHRCEAEGLDTLDHPLPWEADQ